MVMDIVHIHYVRKCMQIMNKLEKLKNIIDKSENIVFFDGAGTSTLSGIKDFRGKNGIYKMNLDISPEYLLSVNCLYNNPFLFFNFYKNNLNCLSNVPNIINKYLKELESIGKLKCVITQNIDGLHKKTGINNVLEIHGSIYKNYCMKCGKNYDAEYVFNSKDIPICTCNGIIRPGVTLYGENLNADFYSAIEFIKKSDTLIVAGSSLTVFPAASLVDEFIGKNLIIINDAKTPYDKCATLVINDDLEKVFKYLKG